MLVNLIPGHKIKKRGGYDVYKYLPTSVINAAIETLAEWSGRASSTPGLFAFALQSNTSAVRSAWNVSTSPPTNITTGISFVTSQFQHLMNASSLIFLNGEEGPYYVNKVTTTSLTTATFTGGGLTQSRLVQGCKFNSREYFVYRQDDTAGGTYIWFTGINESVNATAMDYFDVGAFLLRGGTLQWVETFSKSSVASQNPGLVVASQNGDILVYNGDYPGNTWVMTGRYTVGKTLGRKSYIHIPGDLLIIAEDGLWSLKRLMNGDPNANIADQIRDDWLSYASLYGSNYDSYGASKYVSGFYYPAGNIFGVNWPIVPPSSTSAGEFQQFIWNAATLAPCKFTGVNGISFANSAKTLYFGDGVGNVMRYDNTDADNGSPTRIMYQSAYSYMGNPLVSKTVDSARLLFQTNADFVPAVAVDTDFNKQVTLNPTQVTGSVFLWGTSYWGNPWTPAVKSNTKWVGTQGIGYAAALRTEAYLKNVKFELNNSQVRFKTGGEL